MKEACGPAKDVAFETSFFFEEYSALSLTCFFGQEMKTDSNKEVLL